MRPARWIDEAELARSDPTYGLHPPVQQTLPVCPQSPQEGLFRAVESCRACRLQREVDPIKTECRGNFQLWIQGVLNLKVAVNCFKMMSLYHVSHFLGGSRKVVFSFSIEFVFIS